MEENKEIRKIEHEKDFLNRNFEENRVAIDLINHYNSAILQESINQKFDEIPFTFDKEKNSITIIKKVKSNFILGHESLISLLALHLKRENKLYHLLSFSPKEEKFFINYHVLKLLQNYFNEISYETLISMKDINDLKMILIAIYLGFTFNNSKHNKNSLENQSLDFIYKLIVESLNHNNNEDFELSKYWYYFNVVDFNLFTTINKDLINLKDEKMYSIANFSHIAQSIANSKDIKEFDSGVYTIPFGLQVIKETKEQELISVQKQALSNCIYNINYIIGIAGSGKTFLFSRYLMNFKFWNALMLANTKSNPLPLLYTSYSDSTNEILLNHLKSSSLAKIKFFNQFSLMDLIFFIKPEGGNKHHLHSNTYDSLKKRLNFNGNIDKERLNATKSKLNLIYQNHGVESQLKKYLDLINHLKAYHSHYSEEEKKGLKEIYIKLEDFKQSNKKGGFLSIFKSNTIEFSIKEMDLLKKMFPFLKKTYGVNSKEDVDFLNNVSVKLHALISNKNSFSLFPLEDRFNFSTLFIDYETYGLKEDDIIYYLLFFYYLDYPEKENNPYMDMLKKIESGMVLSTEDLNLLKNLFPFHVSNVAHLGYYIPLEYNYYMTLVDESLLIPNYLTYPILGRTSYVTLTGDVSQMSFYHLLPKNALNQIIDSLYGKLKGFFAMYLNTITGRINSFYDILSYQKAVVSEKKNLTVFYDNFRYPYNIYVALFALSSEYSLYAAGQGKGETIYNNTVPFEWKFSESLIKKYSGELFFLEHHLSNKIENYKSIFMNINMENNIETMKSYRKNGKISLAIITSFSSDKQHIHYILSNLLKNHEEYFTYKGEKLYSTIDVLSAYEVQGMEFDIVVFDTFLDKKLQEYVDILATKPQIFTVAMSRTKHLFFLIGKKIEFENMESAINNSIRKVVKEKFIFID